MRTSPRSSSTRCGTCAARERDVRGLQRARERRDGREVDRERGDLAAEPLRLLDPLLGKPAVERRVAVDDLVDVEQRLAVPHEEEEPHRGRLGCGRPGGDSVPHARHRSRPHARRVFRSGASETSGRSHQPLISCLREEQAAATAPTAQTTNVAPTSVQKPSMWKPLTIALVSQRMNIATKNHAIPSVRIAKREGQNLSTGLTNALRSPKTSAAPMSRRAAEP